MDPRIPWSKVRRGRTHKGRPVYRCERCGTPLEQTRLGFKATPAAQAALRAGEDIEIEVPWTDGDRLTDGSVLWGRKVGEVVIVDPDDPSQLLEVARREAERRKRNQEWTEATWEEFGWKE